MSTNTNPSPEQKKQLRALLGTGLAHGINITLGEVDREGLACALDQHGDELRRAVISTVTSKLRQFSVSNQFANEEVSSTFGYFSGYKPKGIAEQAKILRQLFPGVGFANEKLAERTVPTGAEGWFAIPKWQTIAPTYGEAVQKVFRTIEGVRGGTMFCNYREGKLSSGQFRQSAKAADAFWELADEQKDHDILVIAAQFGLRHRGRSVRRALTLMDSREFGLGAFAVGIMLLTHPERLQQYNDLWIDCAGDESSADVVSSYLSTPCFHWDHWNGSRFVFGTEWSSFASTRFGSASGFLP
jgi:hypothetical protein